MLGRKNFTTEELDHARTAIDRELTAYQGLAVAAGARSATASALAELEPVLFNNLLLTLDRYFVHRVRMVTGKDGNPVNEVELLVESLMNNDGVLRGNNVIKYVPAQSVLQLKIGDRIALTAEQFQLLATAFFSELERKFL
jgi:hypothetical protein